MIDFDRSWIEGLRQKTAIERAAWLWPETVAALNDALRSNFSQRNEPDKARRRDAQYDAMSIYLRVNAHARQLEDAAKSSVRGFDRLIF